MVDSTIDGPDIPRTADAPDAARAPSGPWALVALALSLLLASIGTSVANVGLPTFARAFGVSFHAVQWVVLAYLLAVTALVVVAGRLGDLVGRRRLLMLGLAIFTAASMLCGLAPTLPALVAARAAQGVGAAALMALATAFVGDAVPASRTGAAMGLLGTTSALGTALGPSLGGALLAGPGWRWLFLVNVPLGVLALWLAHRHLPTARSDRAPRQRARRPALPLAMLRALGARLAAGALVATVMMATLVVGPFHLSRALGLAPAIVGIAMSVGPLVAAAAGVPSGRLVDRVGSRTTVLVGLGAMTVGAALLATLRTTLGAPGYVGPLAILTAGYAMFQTGNNVAVMADVPEDARGTIAGLLTLSRNLGLVAGASLMGAVFAAASGAPDVAIASAEAVATGTHGTFAVATALVLAALALSRGRAGGDVLEREA